MICEFGVHLPNKCPLVNIRKTMENYHFWWVNQLFLWPFSMATLNHQRVLYGIWKMDPKFTNGGIMRDKAKYLYSSIYPLVNVYMTMENHNFSWENSPYMVIFYSYVSLPEGILPAWYTNISNSSIAISSWYGVFVSVLGSGSKPKCGAQWWNAPHLHIVICPLCQHTHIYIYIQLGSALASGVY